MQKEEMKKILLRLGAEAEEFDLLVKKAEDYSIPYEVLEILTEGADFWQYRAIAFVENIREACNSGQLTRREVPSNSGYFVSIEAVKTFALTRNVLAEMPYAKTEGMFSDYEEFLPLAEKIKEKAGILIQTCVQTVASMEQYIDEARNEPFKESWSVFANVLAGLSQTLENTTKRFDAKNEWVSLLKQTIDSARGLSESLKVLGALYQADEAVDVQVRSVAELLQETLIISSKASTEIQDKATSETQIILGSLIEELRNMKGIS